MEYVDIQFPPRIALGAQRAPVWNTGVVQTASGHEAADQRWADARHEYDVSFAVRTADDYQTIVAHFHQMRGRFRSFPFKDAVEYRVEAANGVFIDPEGSPTVGRQMARRYGSGAYAWDRPIRKPKTGTIVIARTRTGTTTDITGSSTIDYATGVVSITGGVVLPGDTLAWSGEFYVPCRYDIDRLPTLIPNKRPGTDGPLLVQCDSIPIVEVRPRVAA